VRAQPLRERANVLIYRGLPTALLFSVEVRVLVKRSRCAFDKI